jgi:hypothetical protein
MTEHVLPILGVEDFIVRYEVQSRGTIHAHLLLQVKDGPSANDMKFAFRDIAAEKDAAVKEKISAAQEKVVHFATQLLGTSAVHPEPNPDFWPGQWGRDVHQPATNILRQRLLDIMHPTELKERHEKQVNRTMLHKCKMGYCLDEKRKMSRATSHVGSIFPWTLLAFGRILAKTADQSRVCHGPEKQRRGLNL